MDAGRARLAEYLDVPAEEIHFGPSTSQNTCMLAQAFRALLEPGDEVIVTNQDHEANAPRAACWWAPETSTPCGC